MNGMGLEPSALNTSLTEEMTLQHFLKLISPEH